MLIRKDLMPHTISIEKLEEENIESLWVMI
jgi:hypothetical protein